MDNTIAKINKFGKVASIISKVCKILLIVGLVGCTIGTVAIAVLPSDLLEMNMTGSAHININLDKFNVNFSDEQKKDIENSLLEDQKINIDGNNMGEVTDIQVNDNSFSFTASGTMAEFGFGDLIYVLITATIYIAMTLVTVIFTERLCKAFRDCDTPFSEDIIKKMQQLAYSLIPWVVLSGVAEGAMKSLFKNSIDFTISFNMTSVIAIAIIFVLVYVFKYGAKLQQEADETL